jgi:hypothetical protein
MLLYCVLGAIGLGLAALPGLVAFVRPSWTRGVIGVGVALALPLWAFGWFGGTGDMDRAGLILLMGFWAFALLVAWSGGALLGRYVKRRLSSGRGETRLA